MEKRVRSTLKENRTLIISLALLFAWAFEIRFTGLLFLDSTQVSHSAIFSLTTASTVLCCLAAIRPRFLVALQQPRLAHPIGIGMTVCAVLSTLIPYLSLFGSVELSNALYLVDGILFGFVFFGMFLGAILFYKSKGLITTWLLLIASVIPALLIVVFANRFIPWSMGYLHALFPVLALVTALVNARRPGRSGNEELQSKPAHRGSNPPFLNLLLFFTGFYVVFMPTMFPKTTNLSIAYFANLCLGAMNYVSLVALILFVTFLIIIFLYAGDNRIGTPIVVFLVSVVFALVFYLLSSMSTSNLPFLMIMPCSMVFALAAYAAFLPNVDLNRPDGVRELRQGLTWSFGGGFSAAVFSTLFMGPLYGALNIQDTLFVVITAAIFIIIIALFVSLKEEFIPLLFRNIIFKEKLDSSTLENRCRLVGSQYKLTGREMEVLFLLAEGRNEPYITNALMVSRATIKTHIKHIYQKINVSSRQELLDYLHI